MKLGNNQQNLILSVHEILEGKSLIFALFELACSFQKPFYYLQRSDLFSGRQTFFMHVLQFACKTFTYLHLAKRNEKRSTEVKVQRKNSSHPPPLFRH
jgi:hypothetical protein